MGSALEGLYDVLRNEEFKKSEQPPSKDENTISGEKGVSGETERTDTFREKTTASVPLPLTV